MMSGLRSGGAIMSLMYFNPFEHILELLNELYMKSKSGK